jgi:hypothetical protein
MKLARIRQSNKNIVRYRNNFRPIVKFGLTNEQVAGSQHLRQAPGQVSGFLGFLLAGPEGRSPHSTNFFIFHQLFYFSKVKYLTTIH